MSESYYIDANKTGVLNINEKHALTVNPSTQASATNIRMIIGMIQKSYDMNAEMFDKISKRIDYLDKRIDKLFENIQIEIDYHPDIGIEASIAKQRFEENQKEKE